MRVSGEYRRVDGSAVSFEVDDCCDTYNPTRLAEIRREVVTVLREMSDEPALPEP